MSARVDTFQIVTAAPGGSYAYARFHAWRFS